MDISQRPKQLKTSDFSTFKFGKAPQSNLPPKDIQTACSFPIGTISKETEIFVFSMTCPYSANAFIREVVPHIKSGGAIVLANFIRSDNDLNVWSRLFKLKAEFRIAMVAKVYKAAYENKITGYKDLQKFLDDNLSSVPIGQVNPYYDLNTSAIAALTTTTALHSLYGVSQTPFRSKLR